MQVGIVCVFGVLRESLYVYRICIYVRMCIYIGNCTYIRNCRRQELYIYQELFIYYELCAYLAFSGKDWQEESQQQQMSVMYTNSSSSSSSSSSYYYHYGQQCFNLFVPCLSSTKKGNHYSQQCSNDLYLAYKIATAAPKINEPDDAGTPITFLQAVAFQWVNPKAWTMALAAITVYTPQPATSYYVIVVSLIFGAINLPSISVWLILGVQMRRFLTTTTRLRLFNRSMAFLLVMSLYPILILY